MRWNDLFADLEGQLGAAADAQFTTEVAERVRGERASVHFVARLAAAGGSTVVIGLVDGESVAGTLSDTAATWVLINESARQSWIPLQAIVAVTGLPTRAVDPTGVARRLSVGHALRALSRARVEVVVVTQGGRQVGVIAQVGADYVEIAGTDSGGATAVPFASIVRVFSVGLAR